MLLQRMPAKSKENYIRKIAVFFGLKKLAPSRFTSGHNDAVDLIIKMLEPNPNASLLDIGCGDGSNTIKFAARTQTEDAHGIEIVDELAKIAVDKGIRIKKTDLNQKWPIESKTFDVVTSNQVIEHLWNTRLFVNEVFRVLKPSGYAVIATENLASWPNVFALFLGYQPFSTTNICGLSLGNPLAWHLDEPLDRTLFEKYKDIGGGGVSGHIRVLTYRGLTDLFVMKGFQVEEIAGAGYLPFQGKFSRMLSSLDPRHAHFLVIKVRRPSTHFDLF